jgi:predicted ester cyclase
MTPDANKQICRDYFKAFLTRDAGWMEKHVAKTFIRHDPGLDFEVRGPEGVLQLHDALMPAFPDMKLDLEDLVAEGEKVLVRLVIRATHTGPLVRWLPRASRFASPFSTFSRSAMEC